MALDNEYERFRKRPVSAGGTMRRAGVAAGLVIHVIATALIRRPFRKIAGK